MSKKVSREDGIHGWVLNRNVPGKLRVSCQSRIGQESPTSTNDRPFGQLR